VLVGDRQPHAVQPALLQTSEELDPERAGLDLADIQADHLAHPGLVHRVRHDDCLGDDAAVIADLDLFGVQPQVRVGALQRSLPERLDPLVESSAHDADAVLGHPVDPQLLDQPVDLPGRDPVHIGLEHDRHDRLLRAPARLQEQREVRRTRPLLGDQQLELADPGLPRPRAIPIAMRAPNLRRHLTQPSTNLSRDLALHQLASDQHDRFANEILKPTIHRLGDDIGNGHALTIGHRGVSIRLTAGTADEFGVTVADTYQRVDLPDARYTTSTDATERARHRVQRARHERGGSGR